MSLFKKDNKVLLIIKADYMSSENSIRDFRHKTFYVAGVDKDDCYKNLDKHFRKIKADNIKCYFPTEQLVDKDFIS